MKLFSEVVDGDEKVEIERARRRANRNKFNFWHLRQALVLDREGASVF